MLDECGESEKPINTFTPAANYLNYKTYKFSNPCGRLVSLFPTDQLIALENINDRNTFIAVREDVISSSHTRKFAVKSDGQKVDPTSQRFANWMVISIADQQYRRLDEAVGSLSGRHPSRPIQFGDKKLSNKKITTNGTSMPPKNLYW